MKVLVTGATGFIGGHLVERLVADGDAVRALARPSSDVARLERLGVEIAIGDVRDLEAIERAVAGNEIIHHLAAARTTVNRKPRVFEAVNVDGARNVVEAARRTGTSRVVLASTAGVHGPIWTTTDETTPARPDGPYRRSRWRAESEAAEARREGLVSVARMTGVYGPRDRVYAGLFRQAARGRLVLPGSGDQPFHVSYVADVVETLVRCGRTPAAAGRTYLVGTDRIGTLWEFASAIAAEAGATVRRRPWMDPLVRAGLAAADRLLPRGLARPPIVKRIDFLARPRRYDLARAVRELGLPPPVDARRAIRATLDWYRERGWL